MGARCPRRPSRCIVGRTQRTALHRGRQGRDEHGVAGTSDAIIVTAAHIIAGDMVRAAQSSERSSAARMSERSLPAGGNIMIVMFSEGQARGLRPLRRRAACHP